jgi:hypothetical protein
MSSKERVFLLQYLLNLRDRLEDELAYSRYMILRTEFDPIDSLEMIIAKTRYDLFLRISNDILKILKMNKY